jgi:hypothetical protein
MPRAFAGSAASCLGTRPFLTKGKAETACGGVTARATVLKSHCIGYQSEKKSAWLEGWRQRVHIVRVSRPRKPSPNVTEWMTAAVKTERDVFGIAENKDKEAGSQQLKLNFNGDFEGL